MTAESHEHRMDWEQQAPVVAEEETRGRLPPPYRPPEHRGGAGPVWWAGALLVLTGTIWLGAFSLSQLSSRSVATPAIEQGIVALTEIDELLTIHEQDLCSLAESGATVEVPGFPIPGIDLQLDDIECTNGSLDRAALRSLVLSRGAEQVYLHGADAFRDDASSVGDTSILSSSGATRATLDSIGATTHDRATAVAWVLGGVNALLLLVVLLLGRGIRRFAGAGIVLVLAALPMLLVSLALWLILGRMDSGTGVTAQFAQITRSLLGLPIRNALAVTIAGIALVAPVLAAERALQRSRRRAEELEYSR